MDHPSGTLTPNRNSFSGRSSEDEAFAQSSHTSYGAKEVHRRHAPSGSQPPAPLLDQDHQDDDLENIGDLEEKYGGGIGASGSLNGDQDPLIKSIQALDEPPPCLNWPQRLIFGLPQLSINFANALLNSWLTYYYLPPDAGSSETLIPAALFGTLFLLGRLLNAFFDPIFGWISDHTTLRMGRRLPFMFIGGPLLGLSFGALFFPPVPTHQSSANTIYFCLLFALFNILNAFTCSPYAALLPELTPNKRERIHLASFSGLFALLGNLLGGIVGPIQYSLSGGFIILGIHLDSGLQLMALLAAILHIFAFWLPLCFLRERPRAAKRQSNLFKEMFIAFKNPAFISLLGVTCLLPMGVIFVTAGLPYLCTEILEREEGQPGLVRPDKGEMWVGVLSGILVIGALIWFPIIGQLVKRFGKKKMMLTAGLFMACLIMLIALVRYFPDPAVPALIGVFFLSLPAATSFVLPPAIYADVVDYDEERTGVRREGIYAGSMSFVNKICMAIGSSLIVYILSVGHNREDPMGIILLFIIAGIIVFASTALFAIHPIKS